MALETFTWHVSLGSSKEVKARVMKVQYGDGYAERLADGINNLRRSFPVIVKASSLELADAIEGFLEDHQGALPFYWTPPRASVPVKVTCESWKREDRTAASVISATFEQVPG